MTGWRAEHHHHRFNSARIAFPLLFLIALAAIFAARPAQAITTNGGYICQTGQCAVCWGSVPKSSCDQACASMGRGSSLYVGDIDGYDACPSPVTGACGAANGTVTATAPTTVLCNSGTATTIASGTNWTWTCQGSSGGGNVDCLAYKPANNGACGTANNGIFAAQPTANLCAAGTASTVQGGANGPWAWTCAGTSGGSTANCSATKTPPVNGACGSANGAALASTPTVNLCGAGTASSVSGTGPWNWTCSGSNGGTTASCSATKTTVINGVCGAANGTTVTAKPSSGLCSPSGGTASAVNGSGPWTWTCTGSGGGSTANCAASLATKVNGACGSANGNSYANPPSSAGALCSTGTASAVAGSGPWTWTCAGSNGGTSASCTANHCTTPVNGVCGAADGTYSTAQPSIALCSAGVASGVTGAGPWHWTCNGMDGGATAGCTANKATTQDGACGPANGTYVAAAPTGNFCNTGTASSVTGSGPWNWACYGSGSPAGANIACQAQKMTTVHGICGSANGGSFAATPSSNLCASGTASSVAGSGPWNWTCQGGGTPTGTTQSCSANKLISGVCSATAGACSAGAVTGDNGATACGTTRTWSCAGQNGGSTASCSAANAACPINGACGGSSNTCTAGTATSYNAGSCGGSATWTCAGANGGTSASCSVANAACAVNGSCGGSANTCNAGTATSYNAGSCGGNATWTCAGSGGGSSASCSKANGACAVNGACGSANGTTVSSAPTSNLCSSGTASSVSGSGPWNWTCSGANGGSTASCSASKTTADCIPTGQPVPPGQTQCPTKECFFQVSGLLMSGSPQGGSFTEVGKVDQYSNMVGAGEYPQTSPTDISISYDTSGMGLPSFISIPSIGIDFQVFVPGSSPDFTPYLSQYPFLLADVTTFDGFAIGAGTSVTIYNGENFTGGILYQATGPVVISNAFWLTTGQYTNWQTYGDWSGPIKSQFPPALRKWSSDPNIQTWGRGKSLKVTCN